MWLHSRVIFLIGLLLLCSVSQAEARSRDKGPQIRILSPQPGKSVRGTVDVHLAVFDADGVRKVTVRQGKRSLRRKSRSIWTFSWATSGLGNKTYTLKVAAVDKRGNRRGATYRVKVDNSAKPTLEDEKTSAPLPGLSPAPERGADSTNKDTTNGTLSAPRNLRVQLVGSGFLATWDKSRSARDYVVEVINSSLNRLRQVVVTQPSYQEPSLAPGEYTVRVMARNNQGYSSPSQARITIPQPPLPSGFTMGMHGGARDIDYRAASLLGPKMVRVGGLTGSESIDTIRSISQQFSLRGAQVLLLVDFNDNEHVPSSTTAANIGSWAAVPGVRAIEFGNEPWLREDWNYSLYAQRYKAVQEAVRKTNPAVPVIAVADDANRSHRPGLQALQALQAVGAKPDVVQIHPYGPGYMNRVEDLKDSLSRVNWSDVPFWVTEVGVSTDNGRCLNDNYGWNRCMTYSEAGTTITKVVGDLRQAGAQAIILYMGTDYAAPGASTEREWYFGLTTQSGALKGAYSSAAMNLFSTYRG